MVDTAFQNGAIDIQFLERRPDLQKITLSPEQIRELAVAAALAEEQARQSRRPSAAEADGNLTSAWTRQARSEALR
jgi:hypothetical protein